MPESIFKYKSDIKSEGRMFDDVKSFLVDLYIPAKAMYDILLAVSEAFTNALVHGNELNPDKIIELRLYANERYITADIIDESDNDLCLPKKVQMPDSMDEGGRGIELITSLTDEVVWKKNQDRIGNMVSMKFDLAKRLNNEKMKSI